MIAALETVAVLAAPLVLYLVLRLRSMAPFDLPDPSMHTTFILDPHAIFTRYEAFFTPTARLREAARVGFLVPARLMALLFGPVPGFYAFRYVLALVAIVPVYLLLRRRYGRWAGFAGVAIVMSCPVIVTAWGSDYPNAATVSYLMGGLAALALALEAGPRRTWWVLAAGCLMTMAVWALLMALQLAAGTILAYLGVRWWRQRPGLLRDAAVLAASAVAVTAVLAIASRLLIGRFNFITPTVRSVTVLSTAAEVKANHSSNWRWVLYDPYLLVPPAIALAFIALFVRRLRQIGSPELFLALAAVLQIAAFALLQFAGTVQDLEVGFFSSTLWGSVLILLAASVAELTRSLQARWVAGAVPTLLVVVVALVYESDPHVRAMTWTDWGIPVALLLVAVALIGRLTCDWARRGSARYRTVTGAFVSAAATAGLVVAALILTVAPAAPHPQPRNTVYFPPPAYATALGGSAAHFIDVYTVDSELPGFVGAPTYPGELLFQWEPRTEFHELLGPMGIYHNSFTWVSESFPVLTGFGAHRIASSHVAQVLLMSLTGDQFSVAARSLSRFEPVVVRRGVIAHGSYHLHVWLVDLLRYLRRTPA